MILLSSTAAILQVITGGTQSVNVHASWVDASGTTITPSDLNTLITTATTTTVVASPAASTQRNVKNLIIRNTDATNQDTVTVQHNDGTNVAVLMKVSLLAQYSLIYEDGVGWYIQDSNGARVVEGVITSATAPLVLATGNLSLGAATVSASGSMSSTDKQKERLFIDIMADYGAMFDHKMSYDGACATGSPNIITSATIGFVAIDVGKRIVLSAAGASGAQYVGTITSLNSGTSVNVTPAISSTVSAKGLQVHTDDLPAWTAMIADINNSTYPGAVVMMETPNGATPFGASSFTGRSGISGFLPAINQPVRICGMGSCWNSNIGNYWQQGGTCIAYVGSSSAPTAFGAVMTFAPVVGSSNPNLKAVILEHFWIDCRNGDQNEALKGISMQSCFAWQINDVFVNDPLAVAVEFLVVGPGNASALGEAKDCSRGRACSLSARLVDEPQAGAVTTPITTTTALTLSTTGQSLTVGANSLPASGYVWIQTQLGYPVLVEYTGGGGTTTLTGCTISLQDTINAPATVSGSNVVQAAVGNGAGFVLDGDLTANANLNHFDTCQLVYQATPTWGPAGVVFRNSDSNEFTNVVINGGNYTTLAQPNRITKPGVSYMSSNTNQTLSARNNVWKSGSPGAGGVIHHGILNTNARVTAQAGPNYWEDLQLGNGEGIPIVEGGSYFSWNPNGGLGVSDVCPAPISPLAQTAIANAVTQVTGTLLAVPPQGFQIGTCIRFTLVGTATTTATATNIVLRLGTNGTTADAAVATFAPTSAATTSLFKIEIIFTIRTLGTGATGYAIGIFNSSAATGGIAGAANVEILEATMATFNTTTAQQFFSLSILTGAAGSTITPHTVFAEVVKPANP